MLICTREVRIDNRREKKEECSTRQPQRARTQHGYSFLPGISFLFVLSRTSGLYVARFFHSLLLGQSQSVLPSKARLFQVYVHLGYPFLSFLVLPSWFISSSSMPRDPHTCLFFVSFFLLLSSSFRKIFSSSLQIFVIGVAGKKNNKFALSLSSSLSLSLLDFFLHRSGATPGASASLSLCLSMSSFRLLRLGQTNCGALGKEPQATAHGSISRQVPPPHPSPPTQRRSSLLVPQRDREIEGGRQTDSPR